MLLWHIYLTLNHVLEISKLILYHRHARRYALMNNRSSCSLFRVDMWSVTSVSASTLTFARCKFLQVINSSFILILSGVSILFNPRTRMRLLWFLRLLRNHWILALLPVIGVSSLLNIFQTHHISWTHPILGAWSLPLKQLLFLQWYLNID